MRVVDVAVGALFIPLSRIVPPLYAGRVRSRRYRRDGQLRAVEQAIEEVAPLQRQEVCASQIGRLNQIEEKVNQILIPLSCAQELYGLRSHRHFVRTRIVDLQQIAKHLSTASLPCTSQRPSCDVRAHRGRLRSPPEYQSNADSRIRSPVSLRGASAHRSDTGTQ